MNQLLELNPISAWVRAGITAFAVWLLLELFAYLGRVQSKKSEFPLLTFRLLSQLKWYTRIALALWVGVLFLTLPDKLLQILRVLLIAILALQAGNWLNHAITFVSERELKNVPAEDLSRRSSIRGIAIVARVAVWLIVVLVILESIPNLNIAGIFTSLGLGGIAIGLAAQSFVSDLLSSLTIRLDKPFDVGETIKTGNYTGTVEKIGLKSTTIRSLSGEALTIGNSALLANPLQNFSRLEERLQVISILLSTDSDPRILEDLPEQIEHALNAIEKVRFERARLQGFNPTSLDFEIAYTVTSPAYADLVKASHQVNLAILDLINQLGLRPGAVTLTLSKDAKPF